VVVYRLLLVAVLSAMACSGPQTTAPEAKKSGDATGDDPMDGVVRLRNQKLPASTDASERVVFIRRGSVWIMDAEGKKQEQLTVRDLESEHSSPALSPDGTRLAFVGPHENQLSLIVMSLDEMIPEPLIGGVSGGVGEPTWSPDGKKIAFMAGDPRDVRHLMMISASGGATKELLAGNDEDPTLGGSPAWSPDGKYIVIAADRRQGKGTTLWLVDAGSGVLTPLTRSTPDRNFTEDRWPSWSPDGKSIVFASNRSAPGADRSKQYQIYSIRRDGSGLTRLTDDPKSATQPSYSPDGMRIYFVSAQGQSQEFASEIFVMPAQGGEQRRLTRDERPENLAPSAGRIK
jgi:tricorn protease-like protein